MIDNSAAPKILRLPPRTLWSMRCKNYMRRVEPKIDWTFFSKWFQESCKWSSRIQTVFFSLVVFLQAARKGDLEQVSFDRIQRDFILFLAPVFVHSYFHDILSQFMPRTGNGRAKVSMPAYGFAASELLDCRGLQTTRHLLSCIKLPVAASLQEAYGIPHTSLTIANCLADTIWHSKAAFTLGQITFWSDAKVLRISRAFTLDKVIRDNFVPAIRYSFVPGRKEEHSCTCTPKLYRYSVNAREAQHFCIGSKVIRYSVNAA